MYDIDRLTHAYHVTVEEVIEQLKKLPQKAIFTCCGNEYFFVHVEEDNSAVTIDTESLYDAYPEDIIFPINTEIPVFGGSLHHKDMIQVRYCPDNEELDRIRHNGYEFLQNNKELYYKGLYWCKKECYENIDFEFIDIYSDIFVDRGQKSIGTINKKYLDPTGIIYNYNACNKTKENKDEN